MREQTPALVSALLALVELAGGAALLVVGVQAVKGRLPRNRWAGFRTRATLASDASWSAAHRAGGIYIIWAALPLVAAGLLLLARLPLWATLVATLTATVFMGGIIAAGTRMALVAARSARGSAGDT